MTQPDVIIDDATVSDIVQLRSLDRWPSEAAWRERIGAGGVVVIRHGPRIVGLARFCVLWTTVPFLEMIWIEQAFRGKGLSRRLLTGVTDRLRGRGYAALLSSSQDDEPEAQAWHRCMGFCENGHIDNIAAEGVGEVVFRLLL
jgi:GNAT superfamily N-acetyltransferase